MQGSEIWLTPLILLPGVALMIMSTAVRFGQLKVEINQVTTSSDKGMRQHRQRLLFRARRFRNALASLYLSVGLFGLASFLTGFLKTMQLSGLNIVIWLSFLGLISLIYATIELFREVLFAITLIEASVLNDK